MQNCVSAKAKQMEVIITKTPTAAEPQNRLLHKSLIKVMVSQQSQVAVVFGCGQIIPNKLLFYENKMEEVEKLNRFTWT